MKQFLVEVHFLLAGEAASDLELRDQSWTHLKLVAFHALIIFVVQSEHHEGHADAHEEEWDKDTEDDQE